MKWLDRRTVLRGLGATVALPVLEGMLNSSGTAFAQGTSIPRRYIVWFFGNGVLRPRWVPTSVGATWALPSELAPLVDPARGIDVKRYVSVASGFDVKMPYLRGHHTGAAALLSGAPIEPLPDNGANYNSRFRTASLDQVVADKIAGNTTFKSLQLAVSKRATKGEGPTLQYCSHRAPDQPLPVQLNPATVFNNLFASFTPKDPTDPRDRLRASVLDAVSDDARRLQSRLGANDKQRLDAHLTAISEVRTRILALPPVLTSSCTKPAAPTSQNTDVGGVEPIEQVSNAMSDLLALALVCDLTRVASFQFSGSVGGHCFKHLSPNEARDNEHAITHDAASQEKVHNAVVFTMKCFAYTLHKLASSVEAGGNVLDNSVVLCTSDVAEGLSHSITDYPILVAGKGGGLKGGVHVRANKRSTSDVLFTLAKATGAGLSSVGQNEGLSSSVVAEL